MSAIRSLVIAELKGQVTDAERQLLEGQLDRWEQELIAHVDELQHEYLDITLKYRDTMEKYVDSMPEWAESAQAEGERKARLKANETLRAQRRLAEISRRLMTREPEDPTAAFLRKAIERHRSQHPNPSVEDDMLYCALDGRWISE